MEILIKGENYNSDNFNAKDYFKNGEEIQFKAVGFQFSLKDLKVIKADFDLIKEVKEMNYDFMKQVLTINF